MVFWEAQTINLCVLAVQSMAGHWALRSYVCVCVCLVAWAERRRRLASLGKGKQVEPGPEVGLGVHECRDENPVLEWGAWGQRANVCGREQIDKSAFNRTFLGSVLGTLYFHCRRPRFDSLVGEVRLQPKNRRGEKCIFNAETAKFSEARQVP